MEQLIQAFGIDVKLIVVQIINFIILMSVLTYFLYKPVLKLLAEREEKIIQGVKDAESAAAAKAAADDEKQTIVAAAHSEAEAVAARATEHAAQKASEITANADEKASDIIATAEEKAESIKTKAQRDSEAEIAKLAVLAAEKVIRQRSA